ncbi:MAG: hypothetical protein M3081_11475 [Gemmatimonadota bacterium]|nr:hypothetical protein [Gemmatimonadota bacterium]
MSRFHIGREIPSVAAFFGIIALGCGPTSDSAPRVPLGASSRGEVAATPAATTPSGPALSPPARMALDSGNAQFRTRRYDDALASYRLAVKEAPGHTAPEYGIYMVAKQQGNAALADSALRVINAHTGGSSSWTDSAMTRAHSAPALPKSHPEI